MVSNVDSTEFNTVIQKLREYCVSAGLVESCVQQRRSILAACEDPKTVSIYNHGGQVWPLPQTGQMQLELETLHRPDVPGFFTLSTSYRNEPNPVEGRHELIFPMFEFEIRGDVQDLIEFEAGMLRHLGFKVPTDLKQFDPSTGVTKGCLRGTWDDIAAHYGIDGDDLGNDIEERIGNDFGPVFFLTDFPNKTSPFWNMRQNPVWKDHALKVDVLLCGMETFGSAERAIDKAEMAREFNTISDGGYAQLLYNLFTKERVDAEMEQYLDHTFIQRAGGGIGLTRLIRAMKLQGLL